ncbi:hypothetical protein XA68_11627 [Ophiocordyceps unilateralis]|uniref:Uncharacterized protein n=1 Tax=Ophiocordyceps unilateralis TaxID=268505 RepID=A0A2A9PQ87_OPHUN|nr:hypothetical protein XA68_11627 [Ophiocordyceps unilateralis]
MKSLMPLTLSPSSSSVWSTESTEEPVHERVDDYFPEVLARDLELSSSIFASRRMTAGTPVPSSLYSDDRSTLRSFRMTPTLYNVTNSGRLSLGPIKETRSRVSFLHPRELSTRLDDAASDLDSRSTTHTLDDAAALSIRQRESLITVATSLASTNWKPSVKNAPPSDDFRGSSWIDGDSDDDPDEELARRNLSAPAPRRLPTPPESDQEAGIVLRRRWSYYDKPAVRLKSHSVSGGSLRSCRRMDVPLRPASTSGYRGDDQNPDEPAPPPCVARRLFPPCPDDLRPGRASRVAPRPQKLYRRPLPVNVTAEPSPVSEEFSGIDDESLFSEGVTPLDRPVAVSHPVPPRPGLSSVQSWLNGSPPPCPRSIQGEDLTKVVPLPPDAMETLRVSIACFPETMLLSTSLTVETIRTYSRKVRQPSIELLRNMSIRSPSPDNPLQPPRKSLWRKVVPYRRGCEAQDPRQRNPHSGANSIDSTTSGFVAPPKPWAPLQVVFGPCSDYICDALYAHIVAYNYLSALVARNPQASAKCGRSGARDSQHEEIPQKAASLLGLAGAGNAAAASFGKLTRRLGTPLGTWTKEEKVTSQPSPPAGVSLENMQYDLLRCIVRLVSTAKLTAESGTGDEPMVSVEAEAIDMLFVRSLCEIVRLAEEAS